MNRKINRVGKNTLTVSLPAKWVRKQGLNPGDEISLIEDSNSLILSSSHKTNVKEMNIFVPKTAVFLKRFLAIPYIKGVEVINVKYEDSKVYDTILAASKLLIGFEIVENTKNSCKLINISSKLEQNFEVILARLFASDISLTQEILTRLEKSDNGKLDGLLEHEVNINRLALFCKRVLQKGHSEESAYSVSTLYTIVCHLEEIADCLRHILESLSNQDIKLHKDTIELFNKCIAAQEINLKIFNKSITTENSLQHMDLFNEHKKIHDKMKQFLKYFEGDSVNSLICSKLIAIIELSHHINEELFF